MTDKTRHDVLQLTPVSQLRFGHDPKAGPAINARVTGRLDGIEAIAGTIAHYIARLPGHAGLVLPLACVASPDSDLLYVVDGNRRLAALQLMVKQQTIPDTHLVPCMVHGVIGDTALEMSLVANSASPLHPVDRFEALSRHINQLVAAGATVEDAYADVGALFTMTPRQVKQAMALGNSLSPIIRDAWRAGDINAGTAESFTLIPKPAEQERVFKKLKKSHSLHAHYVQDEAGSADDKIAALVTFVGADAYRAAGGQITEDLFHEAHVVSDADLAKRLADEKLDARCKWLVEQDGWAWARVPVNPSERYHLTQQEAKSKPTPDERKQLDDMARQIDAMEEADDDNQDKYDALRRDHDALQQTVDLRAYTPDLRAKLGCLVWIEDGRLEMAFGFRAPKAQPAGTQTPAGPTAAPKAKKTKAAKFDPSGGVSNALAERMAKQLTKAADEALAGNGTLGLQVLVAQLAYGSDESPVKITHRGLRSMDVLDRNEVGFDDALRSMRRLSTADLLTRVAGWVGIALRFDARQADDLPYCGDNDGYDAALLDAIPPKALNMQLRKAWDAKDYFDSVSKQLCLQAVSEAVSPEAARSVQGQPKGDVAKFALANVVKTKWLPPQMRAAGYDGPKAKQVAKRKK
jgi:ParB family chromosome partitioning protein